MFIRVPLWFLPLASTGLARLREIDTTSKLRAVGVRGDPRWGRVGRLALPPFCAQLGTETGRLARPGPGKNWTSGPEHRWIGP